MATILPTSPIGTPATAPRGRPPLPGWLREPLLHFVLLGAALFAIDHVVAVRTDDPRVIVVDEAVDRQARDVFVRERGREPNADERYALRRVWLDNEVLYREGLALQVDKGDAAIRERVIFKALSVVDAGTRLPEITEDALRDWFERRRAQYDEPARFDFQEAVLADDASEAAVRHFVAALNGGTPGDAQAGLRVFKGRPRPSVVQGYGDEFVRALETAPVGTWQAVHARDGVRAVRLESAIAAKPASFDAVRTAVRQDWVDATLAEQRSAAVAALARKYTVKVRVGTR